MKKDPLLKWFCKANLPITSWVFFCLSWIWTFDIYIIHVSTSWVDDNAKCVLADHIDCTGFTNTTLLTKSKGLKPPIRINLNFTEFVVYCPTRECFIPITAEELQILTYAQQSKSLSTEGSLACQTYYDICYSCIMVFYKNPCLIMNVIWTYTDLWWKGMGFDFLNFQNGIFRLWFT